NRRERRLQIGCRGHRQALGSREPAGQQYTRENEADSNVTHRTSPIIVDLNVVYIRYRVISVTASRRLNARPSRPRAVLETSVPPRGVLGLRGRDAPPRPGGRR